MEGASGILTVSELFEAGLVLICNTTKPLRITAGQLPARTLIRLGHPSILQLKIHRKMPLTMTASGNDCHEVRVIVISFAWARPAVLTAEQAEVLQSALQCSLQWRSWLQQPALAAPCPCHTQSQSHPAGKWTILCHFSSNEPVGAHRSVPPSGSNPAALQMLSILARLP